MQTKSSTRTKLRFGLIGAGRVAESYCQAFKKSRNARLTGVADPVAVAGRTLAERIGCVAFDSHVQLAESGQIDAAVVATPPATHVSICLDLLERGIPVLCEKPVALDRDGARLIQLKAREKNTLFAMASKFRYVDDIIRARDILASGDLGEILLVENTFMSCVDMKDRWNANSVISGGGVLIDNGTHSVDIMRYFIGPLESIHVIEGLRPQNLPVEETTHVTVRSESGVMGRIDLSWSVSKLCNDYISVYGSEGMLQVGWRGSFCQKRAGTKSIKFGTGYDKIRAFSRQIDNFVEAAQGVDKLLIDVDAAVASVEVIQAGYRALSGHSWVTIPQMDKAAAVAA